METKGVVLMKLKTQRNLWAFAGVAFLIVLALRMLDYKNFDISYVLLMVTGLCSFFNAYIAHKKII